MGEIKIDTYQLGASVYDNWERESANIIYDEREFVLGALVGLVAGGAILAAGSTGGGKTLYGQNLYRLIHGVNEESHMASIPIDPYLTPTELIGGSISSTRSLEIEQDGRTTFSKEKRDTVVRPIITPEKMVIFADEATRMPTEIRNALLSVPEEKVLKTRSGNVHLPNFQIMVSTMNPGEMKEGTIPLGSADVSRHIVGVIVGNDRSLESTIKLQDDILPNVNAVKSVVSTRQLDLLRETAGNIRLPRNNAEERVKKVEKAEQLLNENYKRVSEKGRMHLQVGKVARIIALLNGTGTVNDVFFNQAIRFAMASRIGAMETNIDEAPSILNSLHRQVKEAA